MAGEVGDNPQIDAIVDQLLSPGVIDGVKLLDQLMAYTRRRDIDQIYQRFTRPGAVDLAAIRWLVRYLVRAGRPYAYQKLFLLAQSRHESVREEAQSGLVRVESETRLEMLLAMLQSEYPKEVCFAVDWLGDHRMITAVPYLLDLYARSEDEAIRVRIIRALGNMQHIEALVGLEHFLVQADEKMERLILLSLSQLVDKGLVRGITNWLRADNPHLRELAAYKILGKHGGHWEHLAAAELESEERSDIKLELLTSIVHIETTRLFQVVLKLALFDPSHRVRQIGQSVIRQQKSARALDWLLKFSSVCPVEQLPALVRIMGDYDDSRVFALMMDHLQKTTSPPLRFAILQTLGDTRNRQALEMIQKMVGTDLEYGPAAALTLIHLLDKRDLDWISELLEEKSEQLRFARNAVLHLLGNRRGDIVLTDRLQKLVLNYLEDTDPQTRYVAVRAILATQLPGRAEKLTALFLSDPVPGIRRAALHEIDQLVEEQPQVVGELLRLGQVKPYVLTLVKGLFGRMSPEKIDLPPIIGQLATMVEQERSTSGGTRPVLGRLHVLLRILLVRLPGRFLSLLESEEWSDRQMVSFMYVLNRTNLYDYPGLDIRFMIEQFPHRPFEVQSQILFFFSRFVGHLSEAQQVVFACLRTTQDPRLLEQLERLIRSWILQKRVRIEEQLVPLKG